ncbi:MAG TPA: carboxypeptidase regulatory-like domain-containing protein [Vicinamibacterales bacterium]|nr:carboxypeptidase regulatory-like domain-containing protein [Vicinamibacterales bacterium]
MSRTAVAAIALSTILVAAACGSEPPPPPAAAGGGVAVDTATAGTLTGRMTFIGTPPVPQTLRMAGDPACSTGTGSPSDAVLIDANGGIQNVFVHVKDGLDSKYSFPTPTDTVVLDQVGCRYVPRVLGLRVGQPLDVVNSDDTFHNVHGMPSANVEFNEGQPVQGMRTTRTFPIPEVMVRFKCNVHSWMAAYVGVVAHPYFAVSASDGSFTVAGLPPGTYTIEAWHERFGTQTRQVTIAERGTAEVAFSFAAAASSN